MSGPEAAGEPPKENQIIFEVEKDILTIGGKQSKPGESVTMRGIGQTKRVVAKMGKYNLSEITCDLEPLGIDKP